MESVTALREFNRRERLEAYAKLPGGRAEYRQRVREYRRLLSSQHVPQPPSWGAPNQNRLARRAHKSTRAWRRRMAELNRREGLA